MPVHEIREDFGNEQPVASEEPKDGRHEVPLDSGIPLEIFHEHQPTAESQQSGHEN